MLNSMLCARNKKGFTLMEMLIVVAIIAILVAIAIPTMTNALEKSREATDQANIRAMYAECMASCLMGAKASDNTGLTVVTAGSVTTATGTVKMTQQTAGLSGSAASVDIGGVTIASENFKTGTATIVCKSDGTAPTITIA